MTVPSPSGVSERSSRLDFLGKFLAVVALVASLGAFAYYAEALLLKYPPVWPDEPLYTNPAINHLLHGFWGLTLLPGIFPGASHHSFFVPLVYVAYSWVIFSIFGIGIIQARLGSLAAAVAVIFFTYGVARRAGLGRWAALLPVSLLALDTVFLRGALVARADMLELALMLFAFWLAAPIMASDARTAPARLFCAGFVSGLAVLSLHVSMGAALIFLVGLALTAVKERRKQLLPVLWGLALPIAAGVCYIGLHWREFILQFGMQVARKTARNPLALHQLSHSLQMGVAEYGTKSALVVVVWVCGLAGLLFFARRNRFTRLLVVVQLAIFAVMIWGGEIWYGLYLAPLTMIGLVQLATLVGNGGSLWDCHPSRKTAGVVAVFLALWMVQTSLVRTWSINYETNVLKPQQTDYFAWARQVSQAIPPGSTVLISIIPDPYFVLRERKDLKLREFIPGLKLDERTEMRYMMGVDYVLARGPYPSKRVWAFVESHASLVRRIGNPSDWGYFAKAYSVGVYKVGKN